MANFTPVARALAAPLKRRILKNRWKAFAFNILFLDAAILVLIWVDSDKARAMIVPECVRTYVAKRLFP